MHLRVVHQRSGPYTQRRETPHQATEDECHKARWCHVTRIAGRPTTYESHQTADCICHAAGDEHVRTSEGAGVHRLHLHVAQYPGRASHSRHAERHTGRRFKEMDKKKKAAPPRGGGAAPPLDRIRW